MPETKVDEPNEFGYAKMSRRDGDSFQEGIFDSLRNEIVQLSSRLLVNNISGKLALITIERKFFFVPLDAGPFSEQDLESVDGFQYAEPFQCGLARVCLQAKQGLFSTAEPISLIQMARK